MTGRILIADSVAANRIVLRSRLVSAHYLVSAAATEAELAAALAADLPDVLILDAGLGSRSGADHCRALKADPATRRTGIILLTSDAATGLAGLEAGADEFLPRSPDEVTLMARVRSLMRARETHEALDRRRFTVEEFGFAERPAEFALPARIAFVAAAKPEAMRWREQVRGLVRDRVEVLSADEALHAAEATGAPDLFLMDAALPRPGGGLGLLSDLRSRSATRHAAFVILHRPGDTATAAMALDLGAQDVLADGFTPAELAVRLRAQVTRKRDADRLRASVEDRLKLALIDPLTGLYNRRYALTHLGQIAERAAVSRRPFAVMVADVDRFKAVNDSFGHGAGDSVLTEIAARLRDNVRGVDMVARIGGEEFLIAMPDTDAAAAAAAAERLRRVVAAEPVPVGASGKGVAATISIGVSVCPGDEAGLHPVSGLIDRADRALYTAKADGRNQVTLDRPAA